MLVAPASGQRVLVVDDDPQIRRALRVGLTSQGYKVHLASTASEALDAAASAQPLASDRKRSASESQGLS